MHTALTISLLLERSELVHIIKTSLFPSIHIVFTLFVFV